MHQAVEQRHVEVVLERDPQDIGIEKIPRAPRLNGRSAPLLDANEPATLEELQPFANHSSAEAELFAERRLGRKHVAVRKRPADDPVAELLEDQ